jgi:4-hydroxy-tetrahydrodipicolinate reductase
MKILLIGYGKMGKAIEKIAVERGHSIVGRIDVEDHPPFPMADVAIEFTQPESVVANLKQCLEQHIPVVCGTTGWLDKRNEIEDLCTKLKGSVFYSSNYSPGVNLFFKLNEELARLMARYPEYDVFIDETHHTQKKDAPSGTAITLAQGILNFLKNKKDWVKAADNKPESLVIHSFREDPAPGTHTVKYTSAIDDIEITHTAHSREGFAKGAVLVAEWLPGKKGLLTMDDFFKS